MSPNIRGSLLMAVAMAAFTMNDTITKAVSSEMKFGQTMLVRGLFAIVLIAASQSISARCGRCAR
jgi:drug/metabolite transporter (DMT)-like permease